MTNWTKLREKAGLAGKPYSPTADENEASGGENVVVFWGRTKLSIDPMMAMHMGLKAGDDVTDKQAKIIFGE